MESVKRFCEKNRVTIIITLFMVMICHWTHAFNLNVDIDTEELILGGQSNLQGWLTIGRFGAYYSKVLLNLMAYNPYVSGMMFLVLFSVGALLWVCFYWKISGENSKKRH